MSNFLGTFTSEGTTPSDLATTARVKWSLFRKLKEACDRLLSFPTVSLCFVHGGVDTILECIENIFEHQNRWEDCGYGVNVGCWSFISNLRWTQPNLAIEIDRMSKMSMHGTRGLETGVKHGCHKLFLSCLATGILSECIGHLVHDKNLVAQHYHGSAFLNDTSFTTAMLLYVEAVEKMSSSSLAGLMTEVLYAGRINCKNAKNYERVHQMIATNSSVFKSLEKNENCGMHRDPLGHSVVAKFCQNLPEKLQNSPQCSSTKVAVLSNDCLGTCTLDLSTSSNYHNSAASHRILPDVVTCAERPRRKSTTNIYQRKCKPGDGGGGPGYEITRPLTEGDRKIMRPLTEGDRNSNKRVESKQDNDLPTAEAEKCAQILGTCWSESNMPELGSMLRPSETQALLRYLRKQDLATCVDLKKENAHFHFSEMLITMMEEKKCSSSKSSVVDTVQSCKAVRPYDAEVTFDCYTLLAKSVGGNAVEKSEDLLEFSFHSSETNNTFETTEEIRPVPGLSCDEEPYDRCSLNEPPKETDQENRPVLHLSCDDEPNDGCSLSEPPEETDQENRLVPHLSCDGDPNDGFSLNEPPKETDQVNCPVPHLRCDGEPNDRCSPNDSPKETDRQSYGKLVNNSAESIAIGLLLSFSTDPEPGSSPQEVEWLVSGEHVPQTLLPLPKYTVIDPDAVQSQSGCYQTQTIDPISNYSANSRIRGNECWAPPRSQIIFTIHKRRKRAQIIAAQKYMCAGCGAFVEKAFMKRFRYCEYMGKYFCTCCHDNLRCIIPARVFHNFDFKTYKVSNFSYELLRKIHAEPLFNIKDINFSLYSKSKSLSSSLEKRTQIRHLVVYVQNCRYIRDCSMESGQSPPSFAQLLKLLSELPQHVVEGKLHVYSIQDLLSVKCGDLKIFDAFIKSAIQHVVSCKMCFAKGFICEFCGDANVIFPYQLSACFQCALCNACYHRKCYNSGHCCPKCTRIASRRRAIEVVDSPD